MKTQEEEKKTVERFIGCENCRWGTKRKALVGVPFGKKLVTILKRMKCPDCGTKSLVEAFWR